MQYTADNLKNRLFEDYNIVHFFTKVLYLCNVHKFILVAAKGCSKEMITTFYLSSFSCHLVMKTSQDCYPDIVCDLIDCSAGFKVHELYRIFRSFFMASRFLISSLSRCMAAAVQSIDCNDHF